MQQHLLLHDSLENILEDKEAVTSLVKFHENRGRNVVLTCGNTVARRSHSYNQGKLVLCFLSRDLIFLVPRPYSSALCSFE